MIINSRNRRRHPKSSAETKYCYAEFMQALRAGEYDLAVIGTCNNEALKFRDRPKDRTVVCYQPSVYLDLKARGKKLSANRDFPAVFSTIRTRPSGTPLSPAGGAFSGYNNRLWVNAKHEVPSRYGRKGRFDITAAIEPIKPNYPMNAGDIRIDMLLSDYWYDHMLISFIIMVCDRWFCMSRIYVIASVPGTGKTTTAMLLGRYFRGQATANRLSRSGIPRSALWSSSS